MKRNRELTEQAKFEDARSYIGNWNHPGTDHPCCYLRGEDVKIVRSQVYVKRGGRCYFCKKWVSIADFEMHHIVGGLGRQRCFCFENLCVICHRCHRQAHVRPLWSTRERNVI